MTFIDDEDAERFLEELDESQAFVEDLFLDALQKSNEEYLRSMKRHNIVSLILLVIFASMLIVGIAVILGGQP